MYFSGFIVFQIVLVIGFHSVQAGGGKKDKLRKLLCDPDYEDMKNEMMGCVEMDFSEYEQMVMPCCEGLESMEKEKMVEYWCSKSDDEAKGVQKCIDSNIEKSGKKEEMMEKGEPIKQCLDEKFGKKK